MKRKYIALLLAICLLITILSGCSVQVESVTLSATELSIKVGMDKELRATVTENASNRNLEWLSSDPDVAAVAIKGNTTETAVVTAVAPGTATITARSRDGSGVEAICQVTVEEGSGVLAELEQSQVLGTLTETMAADPDRQQAKAKCVFYADGTYAVDAYYGESPLRLAFEGTYKIDNGQLVFGEKAISTIVVVVAGTWEQETQALPKVVNMGDFLRINIGVTIGDQPQAANFDIDQAAMETMGLSGEVAEQTDDPAPVPDGLADVLGEEVFEKEIIFSMNHELLGYVGYIFKPDGTVDAEMLGAVGEYGRYGIQTEGDKQYVFAVESKNIVGGTVEPSLIGKWELTTVDGVKALQVPDVGELLELLDETVDIASILGTVWFDSEITFGTEDNSSLFTFKSDGTITGVGVGETYSHYGIVEKDGKKFVAMLKTTDVKEGKALASKMETYELAGNGNKQTITYLFLGMPFVLNVK